MPITASPTDHSATRGSACRHRPGVLEARDLGNVGGLSGPRCRPPRIPVATEPLQHVGAVDGRVLDRHEDLVRPRNGVGDLLDAQHFRSAVLGEYDGAHQRGDGSAPPSGSTTTSLLTAMDAASSATAVTATGGTNTTPR